jgi:excisionase family DNA binding protein
MSTPNLPRLYTEAEVAEYLGISEVTLYRWRRDGKIGCFLVGKKPRFSEDHIRTFLESGQSQAADVAAPEEEAPKRRSARKATNDGALLLAQQILSKRK